MTDELEHVAKVAAEAAIAVLSTFTSFKDGATDAIVDAVSSAIREFAYAIDLAKIARDKNPMRTNWDDTPDASTKRYEVESMLAVLAKLSEDGFITPNGGMQFDASMVDDLQTVLHDNIDDSPGEYTEALNRLRAEVPRD